VLPSQSFEEIIKERPFKDVTNLDLGALLKQAKKEAQQAALEKNEELVAKAFEKIILIQQESSLRQQEESVRLEQERLMARLAKLGR
jgi:hypothetical protein